MSLVQKAPFLQTLSHQLSRLEAVVILVSALGMVGSLLVSMGGTLLLQMGARNIDGEVLSQASDVALTLMVWVGAFGASAAVKSRQHLVLGAMPKAVWRRKLSEMLSFVISTGLAVTLVQFLIQLGGDQPVHKYRAMVGLTLAGCLMAVRFLLCLLGADPPAEDATGAHPGVTVSLTPTEGSHGA